MGTKKASGRYIKTLQGYKAFIPDALPPTLQLRPQLVRALSEADRAIGKLAGEGRRLPNPHVLIRPFIRREAVLSSRIEGTQASLGELLAAEVGANVDRSPTDLKEVANYVTALEYGIKRLKKLPLSLRLMCELHKKLLTGVRGGNATPGDFRTSQNWIGVPGCTLNNASYVPPPPHEMLDCLGEWEKFLHDRSMPPLIQVALAHQHFEAIHPFLDGNGRVGRLLITLFLVERDILPAPLLYLSAFFEATRADYYERLQRVNEYGEWEEWLLYFLNGVSRQSEDAFSRAERINLLIEKWKKQASEVSSKVPLMLVDLLAANPYLTIKNASEQLQVAFTTTQRAVNKLEKLGIVKKINQAKRNRVYCAVSILRILDEPAQLTPSDSDKL